MSITIPREPDLVLISWTRNPLQKGSQRMITASRVIGSSSPCRSLIQSGQSLRAALKCLERNDFRIVARKKTTDVSGYYLLQRG
ncbi:hypothetical protein [Cohnella lupini]|uniref:Helix-turn-helix protein n=1 Tax=Cohnella lupini TaxID=1294267 RepID=A0A3D9IW41_9BACL|nr:hypothetical protein [Cohnella lupini]RED65952.1 hypothetical protein DFP95_101449 [Cohnella lupini]